MQTQKRRKVGKTEAKSQALTLLMTLVVVLAFGMCMQST